MEHEKKPSTTKVNVIKSVAGALFGVQSERNREIDFNQRTPLPFIVAGIIAIVLFVGILVAISLWVTATE